MEKLEKVWEDVNMEGLPFSTTTNECKILEVLEELNSRNELNIEIYKKVKQWIKFNRFFNEVIHESGSEYKNATYQVYVKIEELFKELGFDPILDTKLKITPL